MNLIETIEYYLQNPSGSRYFTVRDIEDNIMTIRVSDHRANDTNNSRNSGRVLSFVSSNNRKMDAHMMTYEWIIDPETMEDKNYDSVSDILKEFNIYPNFSL